LEFCFFGIFLYFPLFEIWPLKVPRVLRLKNRGCVYIMSYTQPDKQKNKSKVYVYFGPKCSKNTSWILHFMVWGYELLFWNIFGPKYTQILGIFFANPAGYKLRLNSPDWVIRDTLNFYTLTLSFSPNFKFKICQRSIGLKIHIWILNQGKFDRF
jgi:hypothetical protein